MKQASVFAAAVAAAAFSLAPAHAADKVTVGFISTLSGPSAALGVDIRYQMLRGIFGPADMPKDALAWYVGLLKKVFDTPEFQAYLADGALAPAFASGPEYTKWVEQAEALHKDLMAKGGLLSAK